jgi:hypothetical protein
VEESNGETDEPMVLRPLKKSRSCGKQGGWSRVETVEAEGYPPLSEESLTCSMILVVFLFDLRSSLVQSTKVYEGAH